jgi:hypothetical protein
MSFSLTIKKELNDILSTLDLVEKKKLKKEAITPQEMSSVNAAMKKLTMLVEAHSVELKHQYENSLKIAPKDILEKANKKLGKDGFNSLVRLVRKNKQITPDALPLEACCIAIAVGMLTENWWVFITFGDCCSLALEG